MPSYCLFFVVSGFCGVLYEPVWLRLAMAQFGVTTPLVSIVLSTFMAGLGTGSLGSGWLIRQYAEKVRQPPLRLYALVELLIAGSALIVPVELAAGHYVLARIASFTSFFSVHYYVLAGGWIALTLVPWCACMGATIPLDMFAIRRHPDLESRRSFSAPYLSNILDAVRGIYPLLSIKSHSLYSTLCIGAFLSRGISPSACVLVPKLFLYYHPDRGLGADASH